MGWSSYSSGWNTGLRISKNGKCPYISDNYKIMLPLSLIQLAERSYEFETEFILYAKAKNISDRTIIIIPDYCVPRQEAANAFVRVLDKSCHDYNVVIHKHPLGVRGFSSIDDESINANNDVSVLIEGGEVKDVVIKVKLPCGAFTLVKPSITFYVPINKTEDKIEFEDADVDKLIATIREKLEAETTYTKDDYHVSKRTRTSRKNSLYLGHFIHRRPTTLEDGD